MGYDCYILEKHNGLSASAIFYKTEKFECESKGHLNLEYRASPEKVGEFVVNCDDTKDGSYHLIFCKFVVKDES